MDQNLQQHSSILKKRSNNIFNIIFSRNAKKLSRVTEKHKDQPKILKTLKLIISVEKPKF